MKKLFSWLIRLGVLIVLAAITWVIYVNYQQQSGQPAQEPAQEATDSVTPPDGDTQPPTSQPEEQTATEDTPSAASTETAVPAVSVQLPTTEPATEPESAPAPAPAMETAPTVDQEIPAAAAQPVQEATAPSDPETAPPAEKATADSPERSKPATEEQPTAQPAAPTETAAATAETESTPATLQEARMAAWKGQWDKAEAAYRQLQQENPEDFNIHGELGNLYYMQRKGKEAAEAYYQAATLLAAQGYQRDAMRLMQIIRRLDPALGNKLQQELFSNNGSGTAATPGTQSAPSDSP
jgi:predicted negative regulator of RcsB-dependent stress response